MSTVSVAEGDDLEEAVDGAEAGAVVAIEAGEHEARLVVKRSMTIRGVAGAGQTRLAGGRASVIRVQGDDIELLLEGLTLSGGKSELGGGLRVTSSGRVTVRDCVFEDNQATAKGGAVYVSDGEMRLEGCTFSGNRASQGGAVHAEGTAILLLDGVTVSGNEAARGAGVHIFDGVQATISGSTFSDQGGDGIDLKVAGTMSRAPIVAVSTTTFSGEVEARPESALTRS